jgi:hypothetical protein
MPLPDEEQMPTNRLFQTKSFENTYLNEYVIEKDGSMTKDGTVFAFHGVVNFYTFEKGDHREWWEYNAKFTDGKCVSITVANREK